MIMAAIAIFLIWKAIPAFTEDSTNMAVEAASTGKPEPSR